MVKPRFPTVEELAAKHDGLKMTCVCGKTITPWLYPDQGDGTCGNGYWWVHVDNARRSHTRDTTSPYFSEVPFAEPQEASCI